MYLPPTCSARVSLLPPQTSLSPRASHWTPFPCVDSKRSLSLGALSYLPNDPAGALNKLSLISNCGDFQLARRDLWARAVFEDGPGLSGRQFGDSTLMASWLNCNATIYVPSNCHVLHLSHLHPHPKRTPAMWASVAINKMPHFRLESSSATPMGKKIVDVRGVVRAERLAPAACQRRPQG